MLRSSTPLMAQACHSMASEPALHTCRRIARPCFAGKKRQQDNMLLLQGFLLLNYCKASSSSYSHCCYDCCYHYRQLSRKTLLKAWTCPEMAGHLSHAHGFSEPASWLPEFLGTGQPVAQMFWLLCFNFGLLPLSMGRFCGKLACYFGANCMTHHMYPSTVEDATSSCFETARACNPSVGDEFV